MTKGPLIDDRTLYLSVALAAVTEVLWIVAQILRRPAAPALFVVTLGWPVYYAACIGMAFGLAWVSKTGGFGDINPFNKFLQRLVPSLPFKRVRDIFFAVGVRFALFVPSLFLGTMAGVLCYLEVKHPGR